MKKYGVILVIIGIILIGWFFIRFFLGGNEDSWIKDERGVYVEHGKPRAIPENVAEQQQGVICALNLYDKAKTEGMEFNSQCLGSCGDYAVDIVNVPRSDLDNLVENQCSDYREGKVSKFIELDKQGNIVRIA